MTLQVGILPLAKSVFHLWVPPSQKASGFQMVGNGEAYDELSPSGACGDILVHRTMGCLEVSSHVQQNLDRDHTGKVFIRLFARTCFRPQCPVCYESWAGRLSGKAEHRLESYIEKFSPHSRPIHVSVSLPQKHWGLVGSNYPKLRRLVYKYAVESGFRGGCSIFHPFRQACVYCGSNKVPSTKKCSKCGNDRFGWYFSPHFHLLGIGWIQNVASIHERTGYVIKNHGVRQSVKATLLYQLSHCGIHEDYHALTWFGCISYCKFKAPKKVAVDPVCPLCEGPLHPVLWDSNEPMNTGLPYKAGPHYVEKASWIYTSRYRDFYYGG